MKPLDSDEEEAEQMSAYQKELRQRANQSIHQLSNTLEQLSQDGEEVEEPRGSDGTVLTTMSEEDKNTWSQKTQSEAVNQLKSLLLKQCKENPSFLSPSKKSPSKRLQKEGRPSLPAYQDLVPMILNQAEYIQHLEAEVKFCKEELQGMKQQIRVVVVENEKFQSDLKSKAEGESLKDCTLQNSMEQLKGIYQAQIESLDAQVISLRKDLSVSQKECEEVKVLLKHKEKLAADALRADGAPRVAGLCLKCAQHEAVLTGSHTNPDLQTIDRLTQERDELLAALRIMKASQQEVQQRERSACIQVKEAVKMMEEANLCKAKVEAQCEQLSCELARHREKLKQEAQALQKRLADAREEGRAEAHKQREELTHTVSSLSKHVADLEEQLERAHRDKSSLASRLEDTLCQLTSQEQNNTKVCADLRYQLSQAQLKRENTEREIRELKTKTSARIEKAAQEVEKLSSELVGCRQRLEAVQKDGSQWQAEALNLAEQLANAQRQLHLTRQDREGAERAHEEDMASVTLSAQERERELAELLKHYQQRVAETDGLLSSQNSLIGKLKTECSTLLVKLEEVAKNSRLFELLESKPSVAVKILLHSLSQTKSNIQQLALEKHHLEETVKSLRARCSEMEEQCVQHGSLHQRMTDRLQLLDRHRQDGTQQVCELLDKQSKLMKERNTLYEEMHSLRMEVQTHTS